MKARIASIAFLFSSLSIGIAWLTLQPVFLRLVGALRRLAPAGSAESDLLRHFRALLPLYFALNLLLLTLASYLVLYLMVGRPLRRTEAAIEQLGRLELQMPWESESEGGPLLARVQAALKRMAEALRREQATTRRQLTELATANERLTRAQTELVSAARLATVGELAAGVAHEIGNPLSGMLGYLSLARSYGSHSASLRQCLEAIDAEVHRINRIVRGLLDLGRPPQGLFGPVELAPLVETCVKLVSAGPDFRQVDVELQLEPGLVVRGESGSLSQVLINLLLNAAQAMDGQGKIAVRGRRSDSQVWVEVEDSGKGVPGELLPKLFEPFFTTKGTKGSGLGLAVSLHLVSSMRGQLTAANVDGGAGARFTIRLPAA